MIAPTHTRSWIVTGARLTLVALLGATVGTITAAAPAQATQPGCTYQARWSFYDYDYDLNLRQRGQAGPFHYQVWTPAARSGNGSATWNCVLRYGSRGEGVKALQRALNDCYGNPNNRNVPGAIDLALDRLAVDGVFGSRTWAVLRTVQSWEQLSADGIYGPKTAAAMRFKALPTDGSWRLPICHTRTP